MLHSVRLLVRQCNEQDSQNTCLWRRSMCLWQAGVLHFQSAFSATRDLALEIIIIESRKALGTLGRLSVASECTELLFLVCAQKECTQKMIVSNNFIQRASHSFCLFGTTGVLSRLRRNVIGKYLLWCLLGRIKENLQKN